MTDMEKFPLIIQQDKVLVDARLLHQKLQSNTRFNDWIIRRITEFGFEAEKDFYSNLSKSKGGRKSIEYHLTVDMAKELAMLERNEIGRNIRRYFIAKEKEVRGIVKPQLPDVSGLFKCLDKQKINNRKLLPYKAFLDKIGMNSKSGAASQRVGKYPQHFIKFNNQTFVTEEFALHLYHQRQVYQNRVVMANMQAVLPLNFGEADLFLKGGNHDGTN